MGKKRFFAIVMMLFLATVPYAAAGWNLDLDGDGCIDQADLDLVIKWNNTLHKDEFDVDLNGIIDGEDAKKIQYYIGLKKGGAGCDGFLCKDEMCNGIDDDCNGIRDDGENMCPDDQRCISGSCALSAATCHDSDGYDIYTKGNARGTNVNGVEIVQKERCIERNIYDEWEEVNQCYGDECYLVEYKCSDNLATIFEEEVRCEYGCRYGSCRQIEQKCREYDNGIDILKQSMGSFETDEGELIKLYDHCIDENTLIEYQCHKKFIPETLKLEENYTHFEITCDCKEGICQDLYNSTCIDTDQNDIYKRGFVIGITQDLRDIVDFDYCMEKDGNDYEEVFNCQGDDCYHAEYACSPSSKVMKYIEQCKLGCVNGLCAGMECSKNEFFVINQKGTFGYDQNCDVILSTPEHINDEPSSAFSKLDDYQCCSGSSKAYCVYNGTCYQHSVNTNYYEINGEKVVCGCIDASCEFSDGIHVGEWFDLDSSRDICEGGKDNSCNLFWYAKTGMRWISPGEKIEPEESVWEYESMNPECCGDDSSEYVVCDESMKNCICCDGEFDTYDNGECKTGQKPDPAPTSTPTPTSPPDSDETCELGTGELDSDCDRMPDSWEEEHGLDPKSKDDSSDLDGDGVSNYQEFIAGTNPELKSKSDLTEETHDDRTPFIIMILVITAGTIAVFGIAYYFFVLNYQKRLMLMKKKIEDQEKKNNAIEQEIKQGKEEEDKDKKELVHEPENEDNPDQKINYETTHMTHEELKEHLDLLESIEKQKRRELKRNLAKIEKGSEKSSSKKAKK
jgi:hypothetical protein